MTPMNIEIQTQQAFRTIMQAMGFPGTIHRFVNHHPLKTGATNLQLVAETLLDQDVTFCIIGDHGRSEFEDILHKQTNSQVTELSIADFILVTAGTSRGKLLSAKTGIPEYPDRSATVLFSVTSLSEGSASDFFVRLTGPGISGEKYIRIQGLDHEELYHLKKLNCGYPLGVDSIFIDQQDCIMCIPRSAMIQLR
jgi:alpha-D-ribose 1-methylphosphonate 5-triphosphate synthase subunit PhnH